MLDAGWRVRALAHSPTPADRVPDGVDDVVVGDLLVPGDVQRALASTDAVVHIGPALHPREVAMGETVIDTAAAGGVDHVVSLSVVHPRLEPLVNDQSTPGAVGRCCPASPSPSCSRRTTGRTSTWCSRSPMGCSPSPTPSRSSCPSATSPNWETAALVLGDPGRHRWAAYEAFGADTRTGRQVAPVLAGAPGRTVEPGAAAGGSGASRDARRPDGTRDGMRRLVEHDDAYGITGNPSVPTWLLGRRPTSFRGFARRQLSSPDAPRA